jgi:hypothetical protein
MVTTSLIEILKSYENFEIMNFFFRILKFFEIFWNFMKTEIFEIFWKFWNLMKILKSCEHFEIFEILKKFQEFSLIDDEVRVFRINIKHLSNPDTALKFYETMWRYRSNSKKLWTGQ